MHLQHGLQVLREWKIAQAKGLRKDSDVFELLQLKIEPIFAQLEATAAMTGDAGTTELHKDLHWKRPKMPDNFRDIAQSREKFFEMGYWLYTLNKRNPLFGRGSPEMGRYRRALA